MNAMQKQREKQTRSGPLLEVDFYPIFQDGRRIPSRAPKTKPSSEEQKKYNRLQATKKLIRLVNANFDSSDYLLHPTYTPALSPGTEEQARRDLVNYLRRVKTKRAAEARRLKKQLTEAEAAAEKLPENAFLQENVQTLRAKIQKVSSPFKYIYVIEKQTYKTGKYAGKPNYHFHLFLSGGLDRKVLEAMWKGGIRTNCDSYQPDRFGPEAAARYMSKDPQGAKRFSYSKNLAKPKEKTKDGRITGRGVEQIAKKRQDDREYWERRYKGYRFLRCYARYNDYNGYWYVSAVLYKTEGGPPDWNENDWITADYSF